MRTLCSVAVVFGMVVAIAPVACDDGSAAPVPCNNIPPGGCPLSHGVACEDPSCEAVYACREGNVWELTETCPPHEAGAPVDAYVAPETGPGLDANVDAPPGAFGGPGCPPLEVPDCSLGFALACPSGCCGCEDLFVCESGGWSYWGPCGDAGR